MSSKSKSQQRIMGWAKHVKDEGKNSKAYKEAPKKVKDLANSMTDEDLSDFAETKHKGLPNKVKKDKVKKNESTVLNFKDFSAMNEKKYGKMGYPNHFKYFDTIAGIEEEDLNPLVIVTDKDGEQYAIEENWLDLFLEDNPNYQIETTNPRIIVVIDKMGTTKEFDREKHAIKFEDDIWIIPKLNLYVGKEIMKEIDV